MKICVPRLEGYAGGSGTFLRNWRTWLSENQYNWTDDIESEYDVLFVNAWQTPFAEVYRHKKRLSELRVVHRVDGAGWDYGRTDNADWLQRAVSYLADLTIFQSDYCRYSTMQKYQIIQYDGPTIYNPVDTDHYTPHGEHHPEFPETDRLRLITVIWSPNPRKGAWHLPGLANANPDLEFVFVGNANFESYPPNLRQFGTMTHNELAQVLRSGDIFLNLSENDPCPNIVIEAMSSGLPVLYIASGGVPELVGREGGLSFASDAEFRPQVEKIRCHLAEYRCNARRRAVEHFHRDKIFTAYYQAIQSTKRRPLPSRLEYLKAAGDVQKQWWWDKVQLLRQKLG